MKEVWPLRACHPTPLMREQYVLYYSVLKNSCAVFFIQSAPMCFPHLSPVCVSSSSDVVFVLQQDFLPLLFPSGRQKREEQEEDLTAEDAAEAVRASSRISANGDTCHSNDKSALVILERILQER